jgi:hypothetical protein
MVDRILNNIFDRAVYKLTQNNCYSFRVNLEEITTKVNCHEFIATRMRGHLIMLNAFTKYHIYFTFNIM